MEHSLYYKITLPTRLINTIGTLIDLFLCNHQPYFMLLNNTDSKILTSTYIKISKQDNLYLINLLKEIQSSEELPSLRYKSRRIS